MSRRLLVAVLCLPTLVFLLGIWFSDEVRGVLTPFVTRWRDEENQPERARLTEESAELMRRRDAATDPEERDRLDREFRAVLRRLHELAKR